jgi:serine/threonine protein kinase
MGDVYQASDTRLGRSVAIKVLPDAFATDADRVARFEREARVLASLNHPHIAAIYGIEQSGGRTFLVMELAAGETLAARIARGKLPLDEALAIATQLAEALEAAHARGIVHRDLKPANITVDRDGHVKVLDFGLAKAFAGDAAQVNVSNSPTMSLGATSPGMILGTAAYMSPEQAKGKETDRTTDRSGALCEENPTEQAAHASGGKASRRRRNPRGVTKSGPHGNDRHVTAGTLFRPAELGFLSKMARCAVAADRRALPLGAPPRSPAKAGNYSNTHNSKPLSRSSVVPRSPERSSPRETARSR